MDWLCTIGGGQRDYTDFITPDRFSFTSPARSVSVDVVSVTPFTGADVVFNTARYASLLVTTAQPHTLSDGQLASFTGVGVIQFASGYTIDMSLLGLCLVRRQTDTTFLIEATDGTARPTRSWSTP